MSRELGNQLLVNVGSILAANGLILTVAPRRFAVLRSTSLTPAAVENGLAAFRAQPSLARTAGLVAAVVGLAMVTCGIVRTDPNR